MCVPIIGAALGAVASIGGGILKAKQQSDYVDAVNKSKLEAFNIARIAKQREDRRQNKFTDEGYQNLGDTRKAVDAESQTADMAAAQEKFVAENDPSAAFASLTPAADAAVAGQGGTLAEKGKIIADAAARSKASISALGALSSFGTVTSGVTDRLQKNADLLAILNNMRQGSLGVYEQERSIEVPPPDPPDTTMADMLTGLGGLFNRSGGSYG